MDYSEIFLSLLYRRCRSYWSSWQFFWHSKNLLSLVEENEYKFLKIHNLKNNFLMTFCFLFYSPTFLCTFYKINHICCFSRTNFIVFLKLLFFTKILLNYSFSFYSKTFYKLPRKDKALKIRKICIILLFIRLLLL